MRDEPGDAVGASERELYERIGAARAELERAEEELEALRARRAELEHQVEAVQIENANLERDLIKKLHEWRRLDDATVRAEEVMPQLRAVTGSLTYRGVLMLLHCTNRAIGIVTLRSLRRRR